MAQSKSQNDVEINEMLRLKYPVGDDFQLEREIGQGSYGTVV